MRKRRIVALALVILAFSGTTLAAERVFFGIATGGTGGVYYPLGGMLAQLLSNFVPGVVATAQTSGASVANVNLIKNHEIDSAFVQNDVASPSPVRTVGPFTRMSLPRLVFEEARRWLTRSGETPRNR